MLPLKKLTKTLFGKNQDLFVRMFPVGETDMFAFKTVGPLKIYRERRADSLDFYKKQSISCQ